MNMISMFIPRAYNEIFARFTGLVGNGETVRAPYTLGCLYTHWGTIVIGTIEIEKKQQIILFLVF